MSNALAYLQAHAIDPDVAKSIGVRIDGDSLIFPYTALDGSQFERVRVLNGSVKVRQPKGLPLTLWAPRPAAKGQVAALLCEGESDALAALSAIARAPFEDLRQLAVYALPGTGMPPDRAVAQLKGAGLQQLWFPLDADDAGRTYREKLVPLLLAAGIKPFPVELPDGSDLADLLAAIPAAQRGEWIANALMDAEPADETTGVLCETGIPERSEIADALTESRVDLLELMQGGFPAREFVVGMDGAFPRGKRLHIAAAAKTGKSFGVGVVAAVDIVAAGGVVVILDRENGAEEYARRLSAVLDAREADAGLRDLIRRNYRYHAWPRLRLEWGKDAAYSRAFAGADLVIFDSSRKFLTAVGLTEDGSDDYSAFTEALIDPLMLAGIATVILDNTGHDDKDRARGTSAKADLCDVMYSLKSTEKFSVDRPGRVELSCTHSRIGELTGVWVLELGGGRYGSWTHRTAADARKAFEDACRAVLRETAPLGRTALLKATRERGAKGREETLRRWLGELVDDQLSRIAHTEDGYYLEGWTRSGSTPVHPTPGDYGPGAPLKGPGSTPGPAPGPPPSGATFEVAA